MIVMERIEAWRKAKNVALYYGYGKADQLANFDVAIVEPAGQSPDDLKQLQQAKTLMLAYVSIMEIHETSSWYPRLKREDYLLVDDEPFMNPDFGTNCMDLCSTRWLGLLHHHIGRLLHAGYDGIFLDTIGDVESDQLPPLLQRTQMEAAVSFLRNLKRTFPHHLLVQNNGLELLLSRSAPWIDGVCWENPPFELTASAAWVEVILQRLNAARQEHLIQTLLLLESEPGNHESPTAMKARNVAAKHGFLLYFASPGYTAEVSPPIQIPRTKEF